MTLTEPEAGVPLGERDSILPPNGATETVQHFNGPNPSRLCAVLFTAVRAGVSQAPEAQPRTASRFAAGVREGSVGAQGAAQRGAE